MYGWHHGRYLSLFFQVKYYFSQKYFFLCPEIFLTSLVQIFSDDPTLTTHGILNYNHWSYQYFFLKRNSQCVFFILRPRPFIEKASKIGTFTSNNCFVDFFFCKNIPNDHTLSSNERNEGRQSFRTDFYQSLTKYFFKLRSTETNNVNFTFFSPGGFFFFKEVHLF